MNKYFKLKIDLNSSNDKIMNNSIYIGTNLNKWKNESKKVSTIKKR